MLTLKNEWELESLLLKPNTDCSWLKTHTGSTFALKKPGSKYFDLYINGRDSQNRSVIGHGLLDMEKKEIIQIDKKPVFEHGQIGTFDESGITYPCLVSHDDQVYLYYVGWMPSLNTPFQNHIGLAVEAENKTFERYSKAPIIPRTDQEPFSFGSSHIHKEGNLWKMWYTCFSKWEKLSSGYKHYYHIRYATSKDGIHWNRNGDVCIDYADQNEYAVCHPTVYKKDGKYHMWFCARGEKYQIYYAHSDDGITWHREDTAVDFGKRDEWNSSLCYPRVFEHETELYLICSGTNYGKGGLGLYRCKSEMFNSNR